MAFLRSAVGTTAESSPIDALTFWCAGYRHVTTSYGVNLFADEHREAFNKYDTRRSISLMTRRSRREHGPGTGR